MIHTLIQYELKKLIRDVPNFPKEGILFKDITPIFSDPELWDDIIQEFVYLQPDLIHVNAIAGIESRGFFFGFLLAHHLEVPFIPIRKAGKLPFTTVSYEYDLEYGKAKIEMNIDAIKPGDRVLIHDDLLATGGTCDAAAKLIKQQGGIVSGFNFLVDLTFLNGVDKLKEHSPNINSIIKY